MNSCPRRTGRDRNRFPSARPPSCHRRGPAPGREVGLDGRPHLLVHRRHQHAGRPRSEGDRRGCAHAWHGVVAVGPDCLRLPRRQGGCARGHGASAKGSERPDRRPGGRGDWGNRLCLVPDPDQHRRRSRHLHQPRPTTGGGAHLWPRRTGRGAVVDRRRCGARDHRRRAARGLQERSRCLRLGVTSPVDPGEHAGDRRRHLPEPEPRVGVRLPLCHQGRPHRCRCRDFCRHRSAGRLPVGWDRRDPCPPALCVARGGEIAPVEHHLGHHHPRPDRGVTHACWRPCQ